MLKLFIFTDELPPLSRGGSGVAAEREILGLLENPEVYITVVLPDRVGHIGLRTDTNRYRVVSLALPDFRDRPWKFMTSFFGYGEVKSLLKEWSPDIVHCHHVTHSLSFLFLHWLTGAYRVVFTLHDVTWIRPARIVPEICQGKIAYHPTFIETVFKYRLWFNPFLSLLTRNIFLRSRAIIHVSRILQACYQTFLRVHWRTYCLYHALNLLEWRPSTGADSFSTRATLRLGFSSRMSPDKGWNIFLEIVRLLRDRGVLVEGHVIGDVSKVKQCMDRVDFALQKCIIFDGKKISDDELVEWASSLSLLYGGSTYLDPFVNTVIEALACGVPVIAGPYIGAKEIMDQDCGLILDPEDIKDPNRIVDKLMSGKGIHDNMRHWRSHIVTPEVRARFDMKTHIAELMKIYESVLKADQY